MRLLLVWGHKDAAQITYYGLHSLQHRGQEGAGIVVSDGEHLKIHKGLVKVFVTLRESVLDPQGVAVKGALHTMNYQEVQDVRIGKYLELQVEKTANVEERVKEMCEKILANTVIEDYRFEVEEV